jgi:glucosyl-3-phosphoglycerate phosphatase
MRLMLLRHGETTWNNQRRLQGHLNPPLSARGREQAASLRWAISSLRPAAVVSSDLQRARETCVLLGFDNAAIDEKLREIDVGDWSGRLKDDIKAEGSETYRMWRFGRFTPPNGESWTDFCARIRQSLEFWMDKSGGDLLVVAHSGVVRAACDEFIGLSPERILPLSQGSLTSIVFEEAAVPRLESLNIPPPSNWCGVTHETMPSIFRHTT